MRHLRVPDSPAPLSVERAGDLQRRAAAELREALSLPHAPSLPATCDAVTALDVLLDAVEALPEPVVRADDDLPDARLARILERAEAMLVHSPRSDLWRDLRSMAAELQRRRNS